MAGSPQAAPPPASAFGRIPAVVDAALSPNGQHVAVLGGLSDQRVVSIATIDQPNLPILQLGDVEATRLTWADDNFAIVSIAIWHDAGPRQSYRLERHIAVTPEAKPASRFFDNASASAYLVGGQPIVGITKTGPTRVMINDLAEGLGAEGGMDTHIKRKGERFSAVRALWAIDPATGRGRMVEKGDADTYTWDLDLSGEARVREDMDELTHKVSIYGRAKGKATWSLLASAAAAKDIDFRGYSEPEDAVLLVQDGKLVRCRLADGAVETVAETPEPFSLLWDSWRNTPIALITGGERGNVKWFDPEIGAAYGVLSRAFKGRDVSLVDWSKDRTRFMARVSGPASPGVWYLYDKARKEVSPMGEEYPELKDAALGTTRWMTYKARDGLEIPAYVTRPPGAAPGAKLPLVVLPHGGPAARDTFDFDFIAQFLATRGYEVLQPQFRGSRGFGQAFEDAGKGEWGGKMQTDLLDGIAALAAAGEVDAGRVCIVGASYGGYAALAGATLHPDAYKCAASIAGISDLGVLVNDEGRLFGRDGPGFEDLLGDVGASEPAKLAAMSPARHARDAKAPILLIHGDQDTVVLPGQSKLMADRLKEAGKPYEYVVLPGENHYLTKSALRTQTLEAVERFLAKNLPVN